MSVVVIGIEHSKAPFDLLERVTDIQNGDVEFIVKALKIRQDLQLAFLVEPISPFRFEYFRFHCRHFEYWKYRRSHRHFPHCCCRLRCHCFQRSRQRMSRPRCRRLPNPRDHPT